MAAVLARASCPFPARYFLQTHAEKDREEDVAQHCCIHQEMYDTIGFIRPMRRETIVHLILLSSLIPPSEYKILNMSNEAIELCNSDDDDRDEHGTTEGSLTLTASPRSDHPDPWGTPLANTGPPLASGGSYLPQVTIDAASALEALLRFDPFDHFPEVFPHCGPPVSRISGQDSPPASPLLPVMDHEETASLEEASHLYQYSYHSHDDDHYDDAFDDRVFHQGLFDQGLFHHGIFHHGRGSVSFPPMFPGPYLHQPPESPLRHSFRDHQQADPNSDAEDDNGGLPSTEFGRREFFAPLPRPPPGLFEDHHLLAEDRSDDLEEEDEDEDEISSANGAASAVPQEPNSRDDDNYPYYGMVAEW